MKTLIIIILVLLVLGLYFVPDITKNIMKTTGKATLNMSKEAFDEIKETETYKNITEGIKENILGETK